MVKLSVYMPEEFYGRLKKVSNQEKISMSSLLKFSFVDKYAKIYPELFKIRKEEESDDS